MLSSFLRRRSTHLLGVVVVLGLVAFRPPAEDGPFQRIVKSLVGFYGTSLPEKVYLHFDRPFYASGETIWFKAYAVEADSHRPDTLSKVLYVDLLSAQQRLVAQRTLRLHGGLTHGDIALPDTLPTGTYQLRAYTSWMRNAGAAFFFARPLTIVHPTATPTKAGARSARVEVRFFPEGGNLVEGLESEVGFKATDEYGHGVAVQGTVVDARNQLVVSFASRHLGMGSFHLAPAPGQHYRAVLTLPSGAKTDYPLPQSQPAGYVLHVSETAEDFLVTIRRRLGAGAPAGPALLLAQVRGSVVYAVRVPVGDTAPVAAKLPKAKFRAGLAHLTLFDELGTAQCERLVFTPNPPGVRLALVPDKPAYAPHEAVHLRLAATDAAGQPVAGHFSVAVARQFTGQVDGPTIVSHLLLSSDLGGVIEDPGYYFRAPTTPETQQALNDLLLTQGWRRFVWKELLAGQLPQRRFALEQGLAVSGQVLTADQQPATARQVTYLQTNPRREAQFKTDATGHFSFYGLDGRDTTLVMLRAQPAKGERELTICLLAPPATLPIPPDALLVAGTPSAALADYLGHQPPHTAAKGYQLAPGNSIVLDKVSVRGQRRAAPTDGIVRPYATSNAAVLQVASQVLPGDSRNVFQYLQGRVAGVAVSGNSINIRQSASLQNHDTGGFKLIEPLYLLDGAVVSTDILATYPLHEIQTVDILNQNSAALFGIQAYGGVVAIYSRQNGATYGVAAADDLAAARPGMHSVQIPGYYQAREFYAPRYGAAAASPQPDPRAATLYWAPEVSTDAAGQAQLSFYTSDAAGSFQAVAEGLSTLGTPLRGSAVLVVKAQPTN